jgi:hypothetical protein
MTKESFFFCAVKPVGKERKAMVQYITIYKYSQLNLFGREQTLAKNKTGGFALCFLMAASFLISNFFQLWGRGGDIVLMHVSNSHYTVKKRLAVVPSPAGMSQPKLSLAGNNDVPAGDGKIVKPFISVYSVSSYRRISCKTGTIIGNEQLLIETWRFCHNYWHF